MTGQGAPLAHAQLPNGALGRPMTRSTSHLSKQIVVPSDNQDDDMEDDLVLAVPSRSHPDDLSSQSRRMLARPGSSAFDERVSVARTSEPAGADADEQASFELAHRDEMEAGQGYSDHELTFEDAGEFGDDVEPEEEEVEEEEDEEEVMNDSRSEQELQAISFEMDGLEKAVPGLMNKYHLVDRLGEGTFSSVYKAIDLQHHAFDNSCWRPPGKKGKAYVAIKRIYVTSSPIRIQNELDILHDLRGARNVAYLIDAMRHEDQVLAVMPYNRHQDFRSYYRTATLPLLRSYFSCLFRALTATHNLHIIHRDVKPANFLYDITTGDAVLCDYGLAQKIGGDEWFEWKSDCLHSLPGPTWGGLEGRARSQRKLEKNTAAGCCPGLSAGLHGVKLAKPLSLYEQATAMEREWAKELDVLERRDDEGLVEEHEWKQLDAIKPWTMPPGWRPDIKGRMHDRQAFLKSWRSALDVAKQKGKQRPGILKDDRRPSVRANRAGTRGFRAPEVLLKCPDQTVSLDIWSCGIILLCFLTRRFPFFNSNDDTEALAEITAIFGKKPMERCAAIHNRTFQSNIPDYEEPAHSNFHELVRELNPPIMVENSPDPYGPVPMPIEQINLWYRKSELYQCIDLMKRCLELDCTKRWTAEELLEHPFFNGDYDMGLGRTVHRTNGKD